MRTAPRKAGPILAAAAVLTLVAGPDAGRAAPVPDGEPAQPRLGPVRMLSEHAWQPDAVMGPDGTATVVWADDVVRGPIRAVDHRPGAGWGEPVAIGRGTRPVVAADAAGNLTAVWNTNRRGATTGVAVAFRPAGGSWQPSQDLSADRRARDYNPYVEDLFGAGPADLAVAPDGAAVVAWHWGSFERDRPLRVQSVRRSAAGEWSEPVDVTRPSWTGEPRVAVDAAGGAVLVYAGKLAGPGAPVLARTSGPAGDWSSPAVLSRNAVAHQVAGDPDGDAVAVFCQRFRTVRAVLRPAAGEWQPPVDLASRNAAVDEVELQVDLAGTATVLWARSSGRVELVRRPAGADWPRRPVTVAGPDQGGYGPALAVGEHGEAVAAWGTWDLFGRYLDSGSAWSEIVRISRRDEYVDERLAVVAPDGDVLVVWIGEQHPLRARWWRVE